MLHIKSGRKIVENLFFHYVLHREKKLCFTFSASFSMIFGEKSGTFLFGKLRWACPGPLRKHRQELSHIISVGHTHVPLPCQRSKTDLLTLEHGIATRPVNSSTFQSAGPRAGILKLEDCTASVGSSQTNFNFVFVFRTMPCNEDKESAMHSAKIDWQWWGRPS